MNKSYIRLIAINLVLMLLIVMTAPFASAAAINISGYKKLNEGENSYVTHKSYFTPTSTNYYNIVLATPDWLKIYDADTGNEVTSIESGNFSGTNLYGHYVGGVYSLEKDKNYVVDFKNYYELRVYITNMNYKQVSTGESYVGERTVYFKPSSSNFFHVVISTPEELSVYELGKDKKIQPLVSGNQCGYTFDVGSTSFTNGGVYYFEKNVAYTFDFVGNYSDIYIAKPDRIPAPDIANESDVGVYYISTPENCSVYAYNTTVMDKNGITPTHHGNLYSIEGYKDYLIKINKPETYGGKQTLAQGFVMGRYYFKDGFVAKKNAGGTYDIYDYLGKDDNVEVPNNFGGIPVTTVQSGAFEKCNFNSIILPNSLTTIKYDAFSYVTNINYLGIDANTTVIEPYAFDTFNINHIYYGNTQSYWGNICESNVYCPVHYEATYWNGYFTGYESQEKCYVTDYECNYCNNANFTRDLGDGSKHDVIQLGVYEESKCNSQGSAYGKCNNCGANLNYSLELVDCVFENYVSNNDATCQKNATETGKCKWCEAPDTREIPDSKVTHKFENYLSNNDATCQKNATETGKCKWCEAPDTREIPDSKAAHKFENYLSNNDATCQKNATETGKCKWCEAPDTREIANSKAAHKFENYVSDNNATCCKDGTTTAKCKWCDKTDSKVVKNSALGHTDTSKIFTDIKAGKWYVGAIDYAYTHGFIAGVSETEFGRDVPVTRGMFITILARIAGVDTGKEANKVSTKFADVKSGKYYTAAIKWASDNKIVSGLSDTAFGPDVAIERQQLCTMIVNFAKHQNITLTEVEAAIDFVDKATIAKYAKDAVAICQKADIVNGYANGDGFDFRPKNTATRAEAAQILYKFHKDFVAK